MTSIRVILITVLALVVMVLACVAPVACEDADPDGELIEYGTYFQFVSMHVIIIG